MPWPKGRPNKGASEKLKGTKRDFSPEHRANLSRAASQRDWGKEEEARRKIAETVSRRRREAEEAKKKPR